MNAMKIRLMAIGGINAAIGLALLAFRGYSLLYMGYIVVSAAILTLGIVLKAR